MGQYKVFGDMVFTFFIDVEADSPDEAWDIADKSETHKWTQILQDQTVEVHFVEEMLDELEDGYPSMNNEISITEQKEG